MIDIIGPLVKAQTNNTANRSPEDEFRYCINKYLEGRVIIPTQYDEIYCLYTKSAWHLKSNDGADVMNLIIGYAFMLHYQKGIEMTLESLLKDNNNYELIRFYLGFQTRYISKHFFHDAYDRALNAKQPPNGIVMYLDHEGTSMGDVLYNTHKRVYDAQSKILAKIVPALEEMRKNVIDNSKKLYEEPEKHLQELLSWIDQDIKLWKKISSHKKRYFNSKNMNDLYANSHKAGAKLQNKKSAAEAAAESAESAESEEAAETKRRQELQNNAAKKYLITSGTLTIPGYFAQKAMNARGYLIPFTRVPAASCVTYACSILVISALCIYIETRAYLYMSNRTKTYNHKH